MLDLPCPWNGLAIKTISMTIYVWLGFLLVPGQGGQLESVVVWKDVAPTKDQLGSAVARDAVPSTLSSSSKNGWPRSCPERRLGRPAVARRSGVAGSISLRLKQGGNLLAAQTWMHAFAHFHLWLARHPILHSESECLPCLRFTFSVHLPRAAKLAHPLACSILAFMYLPGPGVERDRRETLRWKERSSE